MSTNASPTRPLAFPHHVGPGTRDLTAVLLYHGSLDVSLPGWITNAPIEAFNRVFERAAEQSDPLQQLLGTVAHFFELAQKHGIRDLKGLRPLGSRVRRILTVYPGTSEAYASWEPLHDKCLPLAVAALEDPLHCCTASVEFVWRIWELALELGADPDDPGTVPVPQVLQALNTRSAQLGQPILMLAECTLNRFCMPRSGAGAYATASEPAIVLLGALGADIDIDIDTPYENARNEALAFYFFERVVEPYVKPLTPHAVPVLAELLEERSDAISRTRAHCEREARELLASPPSEGVLKFAITDTLSRMTDEAQALAKVDQAAVKSYLTALSENPTVWATVAGLLGSTVSLPGVVTASLAITAFSLMGAGAVKASRERREALSKSPWAFLYYAQTKFAESRDGV